MSYLQAFPDLELHSSLSPGDIDDLIIEYYCDADLNGDVDTTKSTSGMWLELLSPSSGRRWRVSWFCKQQGHTSSSTAEAEVVAFANGLGAGGLGVTEPPEACDASACGLGESGLPEVYDADLVIALSAGIRHEAIPVQSLLERMLGRRLSIRCRRTRTSWSPLPHSL